MSFLDYICCQNTVPKVAKQDLQNAFECDYDKNPTQLYQSLEKKAWLQVTNFLNEGTWTLKTFFPQKDPIPPNKQACMWITRFDKEDRSVKWSRIPLHAAIIFGAPYDIIFRLINLYPQGARCTDDQGMLPLHLVFKFKAPVIVIRFLLEEFPEAMFAKDNGDRLPTGICGDDRSKVLTQVMEFTIKRIQKEVTAYKNKELDEMKVDLSIQKRINDKVVEENKGQLIQLIKQNKDIEELKLQVQLALKPNLPLEQHTRQENLSAPRLIGSSFDPRRLWQLIRENNTSPIKQQHRTLNASRHHIDEVSETNRLTTELRKEKRRLEEKAQAITKKTLQNNLQFSRKHMEFLKQQKLEKETATIREKLEQMQTNNYRTPGACGQLEKRVKNELEDHFELDNKIQASQSRVNGLLQSKQRVGVLKGDLRYLKHVGTNQQQRYDTRDDDSDENCLDDYIDEFRRVWDKPNQSQKINSNYRARQQQQLHRMGHQGSDISEVSTSIKGRDIEEIRGGLRKLMIPERREELLRRENQIRDQLRILRQYK
jgi:hypothetical protein